MGKDKLISHGRIAENRKARFNYEIRDKLQVGLILKGTEVKSLRLGKASISESYAAETLGKICLINSNIPIYEAANNFNHEPLRQRELLVSKKERNNLLGLIKKEGITLVPLFLYFNEKGIAKLDLGIAKGKRKEDKRETIKQRDWNRQKSKILKENN
jgi:SsrA-binding protein